MASCGTTAGACGTTAQKSSTTASLRTTTHRKTSFCTNKKKWRMLQSAKGKAVQRGVNIFCVGRMSGSWLDVRAPRMPQMSGILSEIRLAKSRTCVEMRHRGPFMCPDRRLSTGNFGGVRVRGSRLWPLGVGCASRFSVCGIQDCGFLETISSRQPLTIFLWTFMGGWCVDKGNSMEVAALQVIGVGQDASVLLWLEQALESLQIGPDPLERISSDALRHVALCCSRLRRLHLSGLREADSDAIGALARYCPLLEDVALLDCGTVDEAALGDIHSLRFLSIAGCYNVKWATASASWAQLPLLVAVDVSRTDVSPNAVARLISHSKTLELICALNCKFVEEEQAHSPTAFSNSKGKLVLTITCPIFKSLASLFPAEAVEEHGVFNECNWRNKRKILGVMMNWLEWILSQSLLRIAECNPYGMDDFWLQQGTSMLLSLVKSSQEDVQERAATTIATFVVIDDETANVDAARSEAVMRDGGIPLLLDLARCSRVSAQSEAAKAIANLSVNAKVAKVVADEGGIAIFTNLAKSTNRLVAEEAAGGLWNLSVGEEHKAAIAAAGGIKALVDLIFRWPAGTDGVLERAAGALANLAADDKCSLEVAKAGGVHALVTLARSCKLEGVLEQLISCLLNFCPAIYAPFRSFIVHLPESSPVHIAPACAGSGEGSGHFGSIAARALANLAAHGDNNNNNAAVGQEAGALEALVQLTCSQNEGVRQEAAGALWNLSFDDRNREAIAAAGGVEALVSLAQQCLNASEGLQERAAGALWGLSVSESNRREMTGRRGKPALERCGRGGAERGAGGWQIEREGEMREGGGAEKAVGRG
ncbi:Protein ARABIDILLO 2 [Triticum urartu]|uniref:Protein ARABIDILLO 2 n=1 Tax=Triticum urartu TaxID=4572 RepID=M8B332_TRIUA|nr:Protein ARABIDILLO 2 [Triticum urartu]